MKIKHQKIIKVGNSYAVTLDKQFVESLELRDGDPIVARYHDNMVSYASVANVDAEASKLSRGEQETYISTQITPEFQDWVKKTLEEDKEAMEELANL